MHAGQGNHDRTRHSNSKAERGVYDKKTNQLRRSRVSDTGQHLFDCSARRAYQRPQVAAQNKLVFFMMRRNSSSFTSPSPSRSASSTISCNSSSVILSPSSFATRFKFLNDIFPVSSSSKSLNAFKISSFGSPH